MSSGPHDPEEPQWPTYGQPYGPPQPEPPLYGAAQPQQPTQPPQAPWGAPAPGYGFPQSHGRATTSMVLGIVATAGILLTPLCCITLPAMFLGPFAIWTGASARREIDRYPTAYTNRGQAVAGFVMGIIATVLAVLLTIGLVALFATADYDGSML